MIRHHVCFIGVLIAATGLGLLTAIGLVTAAERVSNEGEAVVPVEEVVISATKTEQPISQVTSAVEVITGEELQRRKVRTVVDALRLAQNVAMFSTGGTGASATARIRGGNSEFTLVLIDGAIVNSPTTGAFDFSNLTTDNIERIEILRGAQSMLWGSDAIGGVIHIITKRGAGPPSVSAFGEVGSLASFREGVRLHGATEPVDYAFSLTRWDLGNISAINHRRGAFERDRFRNWQVSGRVGLKLPTDGRLDLSMRWINADVGLDGFAGDGSPADIFNLEQTTRNLFLNAVYEDSLTAWWTQKLTLAQADEDLEGGTGTGGLNVITGESLMPADPCFDSTCFPAQDINIEFLNRRIEWQHNFQVLDPLLLTLGYQFREEQGENPNAFGDETKIISSHAGFAQAQVNLWDRLLLTGGFRQDSFNTFGDATTYRVTGGYRLQETGTKIRGSYATGFRAPTMNQLFFTIPGFFIANPNLQPVKSQGLDIGVEQRLWEDRLNVEVGYFWNRFRNLIAFDFSSFPGTTINIGRAKSQGWETALRLRLHEHVNLEGQYSYTITRDLDTARRLPRWPVHQGSAVLSYMPLPPLRLSLEFRYVGSRFNDAQNNDKLGSFDLVNLSGTYDLTNQVQIFGRVENLLDEEYEEVKFFGTPSFPTVFGGVRFTYP